MPFAAPTILDEEEKKKQQQGGVNVSGTSTTFATNVPGQEQSTTGKPQKSSGQYANIQSYLDANQSQADSMGQRISGDVTNKAEDATQKITSFESSAPKVEKYDPNEALGRVTSLSDQDRNRYREVKKTGGYTGPQSVDQVQGYQDTQKAAQSAYQDVKNAGSELGQQQLLKQTYNRPQYTAGENKLDQVLLQNSAGSKSNLENLSKKYAGLNQMFEGAQSKVGEAINQATQQAQANRQAFVPAEQQAVTGLLDPIRQRAAKQREETPVIQQRIEQDLADNEISQETLDMLGVSDGTRLFDINLKDYATFDRTPINENTVATDTERQKYAALAALFEDPSMSQIDKYGKTVTPISFNKDRFNQDLEAANRAFNEYASRTYASGNSGQLASSDLLPSWQMANASGNIADYVSGAGPKIDFSEYQTIHDQDRRAEAQAIAEDIYRREMQRLLEEYGYNKTIKLNKG